MSRIELKDIEGLAELYATRRRVLAEIVSTLEEQIAQLKRRYLPAIRSAVATTADAHDRLQASIQASPELFERPRTRTIAGVKVGYTKQRGQVVIDDEAATIARIRATLPEEQAELLIRMRESVSKTAVYDLTAADLKRLGIRIEADTDAVVIRPVDGEVDKLVDALLRDAERIEEAA